MTLSTGTHRLMASPDHPHDTRQRPVTESRRRKRPRRVAREHARCDHAPLGERVILRTAHCHAQLKENASTDPNHVVRVHEQRALGLPADAEQWLTGPLSETKARKSGACLCCRQGAALRRGGSKDKGRFKDVNGSATYLPLDDGRP